MEDSAGAWRLCLDDCRRSAACAHHSHLLAWLLASPLMAVSPPCHQQHICTAGLEGPQCIGSNRMGHPWELRHTRGSLVVTWAEVPVLGEGLDTALVASPARCWEFRASIKGPTTPPCQEFGHSCSFGCRTEKLQKPGKYIAWSFIWNKAMLQGQVQL